ncbi:MAG: TraR/DksA C4-type zinc finger protein [Bacillota bacterium]
MNTEKLKHFEELLKDEKSRRIDSLFDNQMGMDISIRDDTSELSSYDNHPGDLGTETFEAEKNISFRLNDKFIVSEIDAALRKIEHGEYGICEACHKSINEDRLELRPYARLCIDCENEFELKPHDEEKGRPIEEQVLYPPYGRSFTDNSVEEKVGFDGEDTWQQLNTYNVQDSGYPDEPEDNIGAVEDVEQISNSYYKNTLEP